VVVVVILNCFSHACGRALSSAGRRVLDLNTERVRHAEATAFCDSLPRGDSVPSPFHPARRTSCVTTHERSEPPPRECYRRLRPRGI
jgi:hypothetical protein